MSLAALALPAFAPPRRTPAPRTRGKVVPLRSAKESGVEDPDRLLLERARAGDQGAYSLLVTKHQSRIIGLVRRIVGEADAEDVAQDVFIRAHRALGGFHGDSQFSTWLYRIAVNSAKNHLQSRNCRPALQDIDIADAELFGHTGQLSDGNTPENDALCGEMRDRIARTIRRLPNTLRRAIVLREIDGLSYEAMAEVMRCPVGTVRSRIFRAREAIDTDLQPFLAR